MEVLRREGGLLQKLFFKEGEGVIREKSLIERGEGGGSTVKRICTTVSYTHDIHILFYIFQKIQVRDDV